MRLTHQGFRSLLAGTSALASGLAGAMAHTTEPDVSADEDKITVYGTTNALPAFEYPGQVSVIDKQEIDERVASSFSDVLRDVPGIEFSGGPRRTGTVPSIRGLSGENVLILLDGARQSFISAHDGRFFADPDLISRAEVVRGPASALYGSGAVGGVLALETVDAADLLEEGESWGVRTRLGYQSVNEETLGSLTGFTRQGRLDALASLGRRQSGDIALGSGADLPSEDEIDTALVKLGYQLTDGFHIEGSWQRFQNDAIEPNNGQGTLGTGDSTLDREVVKDIESETFRLGLTFDPDSDLINASVTAYQTTNSVSEFDSIIPRTTLRQIESTGYSIRNASLFETGSTEWTLTLGGDWYKDEQTGTDSETLDNSRGGVPNGESEFLGVFAQLEASIDRPLGLPGELLVVPGIRYDEFKSSSDIDPSKTKDDQVSPRLAASYGPLPWVRLFGSYAEGFRAPSINELYLEGVHFDVPHPTLFDPASGSYEYVSNNFVPNTNLIPEKTETVEFGVGVDFRDLWAQGDHFQGKVSAYQSDVEDLINLTVDFAYDASCFSPPFFPCTAGTSGSENIAAAELEGIEAEFSYDNDRVFAFASYTTVEGTDTETGSDIGTLTPDRLSLTAGFKLRDHRLRLGARLQLASDFERHESDGAGGFAVVEERDGYTVVDLFATWRPSFAQNMTINTGIDNVFDEDYERIFEGVSQPGRNFKIAASWQFGQ